MVDWLREYNIGDVKPFIEAVGKTRDQYLCDEIDILKDAVSIPGISERYVLNNALRKRPECELYAPGDPCKYANVKTGVLEKLAKHVRKSKKSVKLVVKIKLTSYYGQEW